MTTTELVVSFRDSRGAVVSCAGGKGSNLIALTRAGFPVPPGFVVTTEAYRRFLAAAGGLYGELSSFDCGHPERLREQCLRVRNRLCDIELPEEVRAAMRGALVELAGSNDEGGLDEAFAVRSSSSFEDLAQASFAGLHETYLNVRGTDLIFERVRDCFASLWSDRAVLYRSHQGFSQIEALMAVVIQRQVECDVAGVGFSIHPVSGRRDRMVVEANYGLGESVVSGDFNVDHFVLDKATSDVVERRIGRKERMIAVTGGGVRELAVSSFLVGEPCLSDERLRSIGRLLQRVESHYGTPQDIEWGWQKDTLYLLQSRPVTTR
jgi:pyruvate,water dikinase